jgi:hypothetical protein
MGEVVNLRLARKRKARAANDELAERNRARFGRTKAERELDHQKAEAAKKHLDGHRLERSSDEPQ